MPPSNTAPLREPASSRIAEWLSRSQGDESCAFACGVIDANNAAVTPNAARVGIITIMSCS